MEMEQLSMFDYKEAAAPLASRLRPETLDTFLPYSVHVASSVTETKL